MAAYVVRVTETVGDTAGEDWNVQNYEFVEASSMKEAVASLSITKGIVEVWTLAQSLTPKVFTLRSETRVVIEEGMASED